MFARAVKLVDIFGFQIKVDPSWLLIAALIVWTLSSGYFPQALPGLAQGDYLALAIISMLALFAGLILHELAHSLVARHFGLGVGGITLFVFGGVAELDEEPESPRSEFWIAIAGPIMSLALAAIAWLAYRALEGAEVSAPLQAVFEYIALINFVLALFNLIPAFPLDGGRILRSILWRMRGDLIGATRNASVISSLFAYALIGFGFVSLFSGATVGGIWQVLIGLFLLSAARGTYQQLLVKTSLSGKSVRGLMTDKVHAAAPEDTLATVVDKIMLRHAVSFVPVVEGDHLLGYVDTALLHGIDRDNWGDTQVADIFIAASDVNTVAPDLSAEALMKRVAATGRRKFLVAERGRFLGVITLADLLAYLAVLQDLGTGRGGGRSAEPNPFGR
ncbi:site-2 protease family protein [Defluviimonas sp. WL0024]|uniref:Zinc metalloprotease n=2 Tax=Albidovulum TaxID=205889 RepID=A0ABT3J225_9RHOB|nr:MULTISPECIES: site-2 protease family protein [Defluviimonas]MCU9847550.1 site-2 protease family protein [Defluviimonas sp. WL0024]MCW3781742.1 site-2 protease family protein [Defluviimonas salinarum]